MLQRSALVALTGALTFVPVSVAHADGKIVPAPPRISYTAALGDNDPIQTWIEQDLNYFRCSTSQPPVCWKASTLTMYTHISLAYRRHPFRAKSAVTYGSIPWSEWYAKRHTVQCRDYGSKCGDHKRLATARTWSVPRVYKPDRLELRMFFRERYSACTHGACGYVVVNGNKIRCVPAREQCYFDV